MIHRLKSIELKLDQLLKRVVIIESILSKERKIAEDDHYFDPTKFPPVEDSDTVVGEANKYFD